MIAKNILAANLDGITANGRIAGVEVTKAVAIVTMPSRLRGLSFLGALLPRLSGRHLPKPPQGQSRYPSWPFASSYRATQTRGTAMPGASHAIGLHADWLTHLRDWLGLPRLAVLLLDARRDERMSRDQRCRGPVVRRVVGVGGVGRVGRIGVGRGS